MTQADALAAYLGPEVFQRLDWRGLNDAQREAILAVFKLGLNAGAQSGAVSTIDAVFASGRVILCEDGSRWSARERRDAEMISDWGEGALDRMKSARTRVSTTPGWGQTRPNDRNRTS